MKKDIKVEDTFDELINRPSLGAYLSKAIDAGIIDFCVRATKRDDGTIAFYIRPDSKNGDTRDYIVEGDSYVVLPDPSVTRKD